MTSQGCRGFTLIELLTVTSIVAALLCSAPSLIDLTNKNRQQSELFELQRLLQMARSQSVSSGKTITLCGSNDGSQCDADWLSPRVLVFIDKDNNHLYDNQDILIQQSTIVAGKWHWRGSNRPYLRFRADGSPMEWGRFTQCPIDANTTASQIVLNIVGRPYVTQTSAQQIINGGLCT